MKKISTHVWKLADPYEFKNGWPCIIEGNSTLFLLDVGWGWEVDFKKVRSFKDNSPSYELEIEVAGHLKSILDCAVQLGKPVNNIILTHSHMDHSANIKIINQTYNTINEYYRRKGLFNGDIIHPRLIHHRLFPQGKYQCRHYPSMKISKRENSKIDGLNFTFIPTPGHSIKDEDISILLHDDKILFCGDICQPLGASYNQVDDGSPTPIPHHFQCDKVMDSLKLLMKEDFDVLQTGHGKTFQKKPGLNALEVAFETLRRMQSISSWVSRKNPDMTEEEICNLVFTKISRERRFPRSKSEHRKMNYRYGKTDFERYDLPTIMNMLNIIREQKFQQKKNYGSKPYENKYRKPRLKKSVKTRSFQK